MFSHLLMLNFSEFVCSKYQLLFLAALKWFSFGDGALHTFVVTSSGLSKPDANNYVPV